MNEEQQKLYDVLVRDGYYTKSFEEFQTQFQDLAYQDKVFGVVERDGLFTKGKDAFLEKYAIAEKKKDDTEFVSEVGSLEPVAVEEDDLLARHDSLEQTYMDAWKRMQDIQALDEPTNQQIQELQELNTTFTTALNEYNQVANQIRSEAPKSPDPAERVRNLRQGVSRKNEDGGRSTVKMADMEVDGKFVAVPTLFPKDPNNYGPDPEDWVEFGEEDAIGAYEMALERGEVFEFDTPEQAREFAKGSWKEMEEEPPKDEFNKSLEFVNNRLIDRSDAGQVARELEYEFGDFGFNFDRGFEVGTGNYVKVTASNGETIDVNTNPQFLTDEDTQADLLRDFLIKNRGTTPKREVEQSIEVGRKELDRLKGVYEQTHGDYERAAAKVEEYRQKVQADESAYDEAEAKRLVDAVNAAAQADQKAVDEYNAVLNVQNAEIGELNRIAQEKRDEPDAFERTLGKNAVTDFIADNTYRPIIQGQAQAGTIRSSYDLMVNANDVTDEDIAEFLRAQAVLEEYGPSDEMRDFQRIYQEEGGGWGGFVSAVMKRPPPLGELFVSSVSMMANKEVAKGAFLTGLSSVPLGLFGGPASAITVPAAFLSGAMGGAGATLEAGISFAEFLRDEMAEKQGVDPEKVVMDNEKIREVLSDPEAMSRIRYRAGGRGIAIGLTSLIGTGVAATATRRTAIKTGSKLKAVGAGAAIEMPFEGLGEAAGQIVAGQEMDVADILLETAAGGPAQVVGVGIGLFKAPQYTLNGELVSGKQMADFIREADEADVAGATIEIKNDDTLAKQAHDKRDNARERVVIKEQLRKSGIENEETIDKLADLELEKRKLKGLETTAAERKRKRIQNEIDSILDGDSYFFEETTDEQGNKRSKEVRVTRRDAILALLEDDIVNPTEKEIEAKQAELFRDALADIQESDAVQEPSTEEVDVGEQPADGEEVGVGDTEEQAVAEEEEVVDEEAEELEAAFEAESTPDVEEDIDGVIVRRREGYEFGRKAQRVLDQAKKRVKALENFGVKIVLHENDAQFGAATNSTGRGLYDSGTKTIHINLDKANSRTVAHEAFHALFLERVKGDDAKAQMWAKATMKSVRKALDADSVLATRIDDFLARYEENVIDEEALAEIFGYLSEGYGELTGPQQSRVKAAIKKLIELFGIKLESQWSQDDQNVIDVLNTLAGKMERGETITEEELAGLDVSEEKAAEVAEEVTIDTRIAELQKKRQGAEQSAVQDTNLSKLDGAIGRTGDSAAQRVYNKLFKSVRTGKLRSLEKQMREASKSKKMSAEDKEARIDKLEQQYNNELERLAKAREDVKARVEQELKRLEPKIEQAVVKERLAEIRDEQKAITEKLAKDKKEAKKVYEGEELKEYVAGLKEEAEAKRAALRDEIAELRGEKKKVEEAVEEAVEEETPTVGAIRTNVGVEAFGKLEAAVRKFLEYTESMADIEAKQKEGIPLTRTERGRKATETRLTKKVNSLSDELGLTGAELVTVQRSVQEKIEAEKRAAEAKEAEQAELKAAAERAKQAAEEKETVEEKEAEPTIEEVAEAIEEEQRVYEVTGITTPFPNESTNPELKVGDIVEERAVKGDKPTLFEYRMVNPNDIDYVEKEMDYDAIVRMPTTKKYIRQYQQGEMAPPARVIRLKDGTLSSLNRRRVVAAREAGITEIPAWVEVTPEVEPTVDDAAKRAAVEGISVEELAKREAAVEREAKLNIARSEQRKLDALKGKTDKRSVAERKNIKQFIEDLKTMSVEEARAKRQPSAREQRVAANEYDLKSLKKVGEGSTRVVYDLGDGRVLKRAKNPRGLMQNDAIMWADKNEILLELLPEVYFDEEGADYVIHEKVPRNDSAVRKFLKPLKDVYDENRVPGDRYIHPKVMRQMEEMGLGDFLNYDLLMGDFVRPSSWGQRENGDFVLIDDGTLSRAALEYKFGKLVPVPESYQESWAEVKKLKGQPSAREQRVFVNERGTEFRREGESRMRPMTLETVENFVYRAGNVTDKAEPRGMMDGGRSTGHFGTGAYFFSDRKRAREYAKQTGDRDVTAVDTRDYNLAPASKYLHDTLRRINGRVKYNKPHTFTAKEVEAVLDAIRFPGIQTPEILAQRKAQMPEAERAAKEATRLYNEPGNIDSASTSVMKALGYDGVYATPGSDMDNSTYGTVIYDVKTEPSAREQRVVYHVTPKRNKRGIQSKGIEKGRKAMWSRGVATLAGQKRDGFDTANRSFVFSDLNDALQWAIKTRIEKDTEVSVVAVNAEGKNLQEDTALTQDPFGGLSSALYTEDVIAADDILGVQDVTIKNFGKTYDESGNIFTEDSFGLEPKAREQRVADVVERYEFRPNGSLKNAELAPELRRNLKRYGFGVKQFGTRMDDFHIVNLATGRKVDPKKLIAKDRADEKVEMEQRAELRERDAKERMEREEVEEAKARELQEMRDQYVDFPEEMLSAPSRLSPRQQRESLQDNAGKFNDTALVKFAKERGYSDAAILKVRPTAQAAIDAYDAQATRLSREVQGIIQRARERARGDKKIQAIENKGLRTRAVNDRIIKDVKAYIQKSKMYEEASDVGREAMMRAVDKQMGRRIKAAPSVIKLLGLTPDGDVLIDKKGLLEQIRVMARSSKATAAASREIMREVGKDIARLKATGTISGKQATAILRNMANMDPFNPVQVENFVNYTARVFAEAEYIEEVNRLNKLRKRALKNAGKKLGISPDLMPMLQTLLNMDARLVPERFEKRVNNELIEVEVFEKYKELVNDLGERKTVLNLKERTQMFDDVVDIMSGINEELAKKEELFARYEAYTSKADSVKGKIADMVKDEVVTKEEADILLKYANELKEERKMSEEEKEKAREEERAKLVDAIQRLPNLDRKFPTQMENKLVRRFNKLVRTEGLLGLSNADLKNVLRVADNIQNGFLPHTAQVLVEQVEVNNRAVVVEQAIKEAKLPNIARIRALLGGVTNNTAIARVVNRNPLRFIDQVYGDYRTTRIYDAAFKDLASSYASYKSDIMGVQQRLDRVEEKLIKSLGRNPNSVIRSKFLIGAYMMQAEFDTNPDVPGVFDAVSLLDETIKKSERSKGSAYYSPATAKVLNDIRKKIDGKSAEEIRDMLSAEERAVADEIRAINDELTPKAEYVAGVLRGVPFRPFSQYFHRIVLTQDDKAGLRGVDALIDEAKTRMRKPSTKAQNIQQRIATSPPAVNFDPFASARRGARYILTDYHMTEAVRTNARLMNKLEDTDMTPKQRQFYNAINNASEATIADALVQSYTISTLGEQAVEMLKRQGYRVVLADMPRMVGELLSNILFVSAAAGRQFAVGIGKYYNTMATNGSDVMKNVGSVQTTRLYADSKTISSRMVESIRATTGPEKNDVGQAVFNRAKQIWAYSGAPWGGAVNSLADFMITTPDKIVTRPVWFGTFAEEFKARSGKEVDFDKIAANDEAYMAANEEAIKAATDAADLASVQTGATDNPFLGIVNSFRKSGGTAAGTLIKAINSYMTRFLVFEFVTARTAINASVGNGTITKMQGVKLLSAVLMRMVAYVFITNALRDMLDKALNIDEPEDDDKTLEEEFDDAVFQGIVSLVVGGTYGSVLRGVAGTGIEFGRKELMEDAGLDYEYDDSVFIPLISPAQDGRPYKKMTDLLARLSGPYNPIVRPAILASKLAFDSDKKEVEAIKRRDEEFYRLGLEVLGLMGMVPFYKDIRRVFVKEIYKDLDKDDTPENIEKRIEEELKKLRKEAKR